MKHRIDRTYGLLFALLVTLLGACSPQAEAAESEEGMAAYRKGLYYLDQSNHEESMSYLDIALAAGVDDPLLHFDRCMVLSELGRMEEATAERDLYHYKRKERSEGEEFVDCIRLQSRGHEDEALERLEALVEEFPDSMRFRLQRAHIHVAMGNKEEALLVMKDCLERSPDDLLTLVGMGGLLEQLGRHEEALEYLDRADALEPNEWRITANRALTLASLGREEEALAAHALAAKLDPGNAEGAFEQGRALARLGQWQQALDAYDRALAAFPDHARAHSARGTALARLGREDEAIVAYERATVLDPDFVEPFFERSKLHLQREEFSYAMQGLQMVLRRAPNNVEALFMKGQLMHHLGNTKGAFFSLQRAHDLAPENEHITALYEEVKKNVDDPDAKLDPNHQH